MARIHYRKVYSRYFQFNIISNADIVFNNIKKKSYRITHNSGTELNELPPEKEGDYELGASINGIQLNPLNYAPIHQDDIKKELIPIHQVEGIIDECKNEVDNNGKGSNFRIFEL